MILRIVLLILLLPQIACGGAGVMGLMGGPAGGGGSNYCASYPGDDFCADFSGQDGISITGNTFTTGEIDTTTFPGESVLKIVMAAGPSGDLYLTPPSDLNNVGSYTVVAHMYSACANTSTSMLMEINYRNLYLAATPCNTWYEYSTTTTLSSDTDRVRIIANPDTSGGDTFYIKDIRVYQ